MNRFGKINEEPETESVDPVCWICYESSEGLFTPCRCSGSISSVHSDCLNQWRATDPTRNGERCSVCGYKYRLGMTFDSNTNCSKIVRFLGNHPIIFYILNQTFILLGSITIRFIDRQKLIIHQFGPILGVPDDSAIRDWRVFLHQHIYLATYYTVMVALVIAFWIVMFLINLLRIKNRQLYLKNFCYIGVNTGCCLCVWIIISYLFNPFLGVLTLSMVLQLFLSIHYNYIDNLQEMQLKPVLAYNPDLDLLD